jgi:hypothetical protein
VKQTISYILLCGDYLKAEITNKKCIAVVILYIPIITTENEDTMQKHKPEILF